MKKRRRSILMVLVLVFAFATGVVAKDVYDVIKAQLRKDFTIEIDGVEREFKNVNGETVYPILYEGTTYLPVRAIGEIMGKEVYWYEADKRIELKDKTDSTVTDADVIVSDKKKDEKKTNTVNEADYIGEDKAKKIALNKAGLKESEVSFLKVELDRDNGIVVYDVEFNSDRKEYSAEVKATDGTILEWDVDYDD